MEANEIKISYAFKVKNGLKKELSIKIDPVTLTMIHAKSENYPDWTRLDYKQCDCCVLETEQHPFCPAAISIVPVVDAFIDINSIDTGIVTCTTPTRRIIRETDATETIANAFMLFLSASACPCFSLLKPWILDFNPFSTLEGVLYKMCSAWLMGQYFHQKKKNSIQIDFERIEAFLKGSSIILERLFDRIKGLSILDGNANAIIRLSSYTNLLEAELSNKMEVLDHIFKPWIEGNHQLLMQKTM